MLAAWRLKHSMIRNYIHIALRNFAKDRTYTLINLVGLAIGLASVLLIFSYVKYESSYDKSYSNSPRVYRLINENQPSVMLPKPLATTLQKEFPEIEAVTPFAKGAIQLSKNKELIPASAIIADSNFFKVFNLPIVAGNHKNPLAQTDNIVISQKLATLLFGQINPIGEFLETESVSDHPSRYQITAIIEDIPQNTHFSADLIIAANESSKALNW